MGDAVIDLDTPAERSTKPDVWRRLRSARVPAPVVVALLLAGVLGGVIGAHQWMAARRREEVTLFLTVAGLESGGGEAGRMSVEGSVAVVNGGPLPIEVSGAGAGEVTLKGRHTIAPDATGWFAASAVLSCPDGVVVKSPSAYLPVDLSVLTSNGRRRTVTTKLQLMGSRWYDFAARSCPPPR